MHEPDVSTPGTNYPQPQFPSQPPPPPPGKGMIKVSGIILIVFGSIALLLLLMLLPFLGELMDELGSGYAISLFFGFLGAGCTLAFGIIGVRNAGNAAKAQSIITMGIILIVLHAIDLFAATIVGEVDASTVVGKIIGLTLPILYIVGGNMNKKGLKL